MTIKNYKTYIAPSNWYSLQLPSTWGSEETENNLTTFFDEVEGVGALQISAYKYPRKASISVKKELENFLESKLPPGVSVTTNENLSKEIAKATFEYSDGIFWEYHAVKKEGLLFFITYNCRTPIKASELSVVKEIIDGIEVKIKMGSSL